MAVEAMRGCGYRKVGGLYLCGGGTGMDCDRLPYELEICPVCGSGVKFTRGWTWINWDKYASRHVDCKEPMPVITSGTLDIGNLCSVCHPHEHPQPYGLLWVGEANYTPQSFIQEALSMGVSRKIAAVPKNLKLGETWVLFAHKKALGKPSIVDTGKEWELGETTEASAVFYAFRPTSLELLIWQSDAKPEYLKDLGKRGITPVIIPDDEDDHHPDTKEKITASAREAVAFGNTLAVLRQKIGK